MYSSKNFIISSKYNINKIYNVNELLKKSDEDFYDVDNKEIQNSKSLLREAMNENENVK